MQDFNRYTAFDRILFGVILMTIGQYLLGVFKQDLLMIVFGCFGWYYIFSGFFRIKGKRLPFTGFYRLVFILYMIVVAVMLIRGYFIDYPYQYFTFQGMVNFHLFSPVMFTCYFVPLLVFIPRDYFSLRVPLKYATIIGYVSLILFLVSYPTIMHYSMLSAMGVEDVQKVDTSTFALYESFTFLVLCFPYITKKQWAGNMLGLFAVLVTMALLARRSAVLMYGFFLGASLYFWAKSKKNLSRYLLYGFGLLLLVGCVYVLFNSETFQFLQNRGFEDTRSNVDEALLSQMSDWELIFGKGLNGRYYYPILEDDFLNGWRYGSETGFYNYVLKGGYLMMILYFYLLLVPAYKGLFKSKNLLCKIGAVYIILSLIQLYPFGWFTFNTKFFIIWMMVSICMSRKWLNMNDTEIKKHLFS